MYLIALLCSLLGIACMAAGRQIALGPDTAHGGKAREELRALARAGAVMAGVFLTFAGLILFLVAPKP